jgi:hypothetical protein
MTLWQIVRDQKEGRYKAKHCFNDHKGGYSIDGLLAEGLQKGITDDPKNNISDFLRDKLSCIVLSRELKSNPLNNMNAMVVRQVPKKGIMSMFKDNVIKNNYKTSIRELAILNDQSEMDFDDFEQVFMELGL